MLLDFEGTESVTQSVVWFQWSYKLLVGFTVQTIWLKFLCIVRHYSEILVDLFITHYAGSMGQWKGVEVGGGGGIK